MAYYRAAASPPESTPARVGVLLVNLGTPDAPGYFAVQRYLRACGFKVTYVRNITDIDDKIIQRAAERGEDWSELARRFTVATAPTKKAQINPPPLMCRTDRLGSGRSSRLPDSA